MPLPMTFPSFFPEWFSDDAPPLPERSSSFSSIAVSFRFTISVIGMEELDERVLLHPMRRFFLVYSALVATGWKIRSTTGLISHFTEETARNHRRLHIVSKYSCCSTTLFSLFVHVCTHRVSISLSLFVCFVSCLLMDHNTFFFSFLSFLSSRADFPRDSPLLREPLSSLAQRNETLCVLDAIFPPFGTRALARNTQRTRPTDRPTAPALKRVHFSLPGSNWNPSPTSFVLRYTPMRVYIPRLLTRPRIKRGGKRRIDDQHAEAGETKARRGSEKWRMTRKRKRRQKVVAFSRCSCAQRVAGRLAGIELDGSSPGNRIFSLSLSCTSPLSLCARSHFVSLSLSLSFYTSVFPSPFLTRFRTGAPLAFALTSSLAPPSFLPLISSISLC